MDFRIDPHRIQGVNGFTNINDKFLDAQGKLAGFRSDMLHPNSDGYEVWASAVAPTLKGWIN
jgi:lysophospholipase L1-like esterase